MDKGSIARVLDALYTLYPEARAELNFSNPFETLIATILAAQCTDKRVNIVTERLFAVYPDAGSLGALAPDELEPLIRECGLYHTKAKNIIATCHLLTCQYGGEVPSTIEQLVALPGVGRKTAAVVMAFAFGDDQIPVDTHVFRVANRIGLAHAGTPLKVETQLKECLPKPQWSQIHHLLIWHGRRCCAARRPACERCPLTSWCEYFAAGQGETGGADTSCVEDTASVPDD